MSGWEYAHTLARTSNTPDGAAPTFGIYRPATDSWQVDIRHTLDELQNHSRGVILPSLGQSRLGQLRASRSLGLTFVERSSVDEDDLTHVDFPSLLKRVGEVNSGTDAVEVPIDHMEWGGYRKSVLTAFLAKSGALSQLMGEAVEVADILTDAGLPSIPVKEPNHVSLLRFYIPRHGANYMKPRHRTEIKQFATALFMGASIESVPLSSLHMGETYNRPYVLEDWQPDESAAFTLPGDYFLNTHE